MGSRKQMVVGGIRHGLTRKHVIGANISSPPPPESERIKFDRHIIHIKYKPQKHESHLVTSCPLLHI